MMNATARAVAKYAPHTLTRNVAAMGNAPAWTGFATFRRIDADVIRVTQAASSCPRNEVTDMSEADARAMWKSLTEQGWAR